VEKLSLEGSFLRFPAWEVDRKIFGWLGDPMTVIFEFNLKPISGPESLNEIENENEVTA
jgi:hypothetical protein